MLPAALVLTNGHHACGAIVDSFGQPNPTWQNDAMLLWLKADAGVTKDASNLVSAWADQSTYGHTAAQTNTSYMPQFSAAGLNGQPVLTFAGSGQHMLISAGPVNQQTLLIVYQDTSTNDYVTPVGTAYDGDGAYHGFSDDTQLFHSGYTEPDTLNGANFRNGVDIGNGLSTPRPDSWALDAHVAVNPLTQQVTTIGADHNFGSSRDINGGIAEILLYDRPLDLAELNQVGYYLEKKYALDTEYSYVPANAIADSQAEFTGDQGTLNWQYGQYASTSDTTFSELTTYSNTPTTLIGNDGPHWSNSGDYPKLWETGGHPSPSKPAVRRWTSEATGVVKITGDLAKFDPNGGDGITGEIRVGGARNLAQTIAGTDDKGIAYTTFARVQTGQPVDLIIDSIGSHSHDSTKFTATIEPVPAERVIDLADIVGAGNGHGTGNYPGGYEGNTGAFSTDVGPSVLTASAGFQQVSPNNDLIDGVFIARLTADGPTQLTSTGITATIPEMSGSGAYFNIRNFLGNAGNNESLLDGVDYNNVDGHSMIAIHPNHGITFDLDAVEAANPGLYAEFFSAVAGLSTTNTNAKAGFGVFVDGVLEFQYTVTSPAEVGVGIPINVALRPDARFLTLVSMDYDGFAADGIFFGDPLLILDVPEPGSAALLLLRTMALLGIGRRRR